MLTVDVIPKLVADRLGEAEVVVRIDGGIPLPGCLFVVTGDACYGYWSEEVNRDG
jgi:hypothetical protein